MDHSGKTREELIEELLALKQSFNALKEKYDKELSQEQLLINALLNTLPDHIYFKDMESRFIRNSKSHTISFGFDNPADVKGKSDFDFFSEQAARQAYEDEQGVISTGQPIMKEEKLTRKDNSEVWFSAMKLPLRDNDGNILGTFGISRDITLHKMAEEALKQSEERFRSVSQSANDAIISIDNNEHFIGWNSGAERTFGYTEPEIEGKPLNIIIHPDYHVLKAKVIKLLRRGGGKHLQGKTVELNGLRKNGDVFPVELSFAGWKTSEGQFFTGILREITNRKKAEEEIKIKNELLQAINAEKDKFFSIIAHDLRGPMSAFVAATGILTEDIQNMTLEEIRDITISMKTDATNIYRLLENLLQWSRLKRGVLEFNPERLNLKSVIKSGIEAVLASAKKKQIGIDDSVPEDIEIIADKHMFETVVRNLVSNSVKFTPAGGKVIISAGSDQHNIEIRISDKGIGMSRELLDKLFHLNEKTSRPGTEGEPSTGLGLLLCKEFIEKHGGKIWVDSETGLGSVFSFTIPVAVGQ